MHKLESQTRFLKMQFPRTSDAHEYAQSTSRGTFRVSCALRCDTYTAAGSGHWAEREREGSEGVAVEGVVLATRFALTTGTVCATAAGTVEASTLAR